MNKTLAVLSSVLSTLVVVPGLPGDEPGDVKPERLKAVVAEALALIQKSAEVHTRNRECFTCHHQAMPMIAVSVARQQGFAVDHKMLRDQLEFTAASLQRGRERYLEGRGQGGRADTAGYALLALEMGGWQRDATTAAVAEYLLLWQKDLDHWKHTSTRPPSEASSFTTTYLALRGLQAFGTDEQQQRIRQRVDQARKWLLCTSAKDTEDRVFRLWALRYSGRDDSAIQAAAEELSQTQRSDGGWAQTEELESDAYATGSALVALHQAGRLPVSDAVYQRGVKFLVEDYLEDGSWLVNSRSNPFQKYFETGFPHGTDQWISIAATSWATAALALACPPVTAPHVASTLPP